MAQAKTFLRKTCFATQLEAGQFEFVVIVRIVAIQNQADGRVELTAGNGAGLGLQGGRQCRQQQGSTDEKRNSIAS